MNPLVMSIHVFKKNSHTVGNRVGEIARKGKKYSSADSCFPMCVLDFFMYICKLNVKVMRGRKKRYVLCINIHWAGERHEILPAPVFANMWRN